MNILYDGLDYVRTYIEGLPIISNKCLEDHIKKLDKVKNKLKLACSKMTAKKSIFARNELEYIEVKIIREGLMPLPDKVEVLKNVAGTKTKKQLQRFLKLSTMLR